MGRRPTSPTKSFAIGRLKKAKPIVAPHSARLTTVSQASRGPRAQQ